MILHVLAAAFWLPGNVPVKADFQGVNVMQTGIYRCTNGVIEFRSNAPLEVIEAKSREMQGAIDPSNQSFAWLVEVTSFEGFNSPLQREHFNENYLESNRFSRATFTGKIIEKVNFDQDGVYSVRAKGRLNIHGTEQERIIKGKLEKKGQKLIISASFTVPLTDHNITIPKIVHQKIAEEIFVTVNAELSFVQ